MIRIETPFKLTHAAKQDLKSLFPIDPVSNITYKKKLTFEELAFGFDLYDAMYCATGIRQKNMSGVIIDCTAGVQPHVDKLDHALYTNFSLAIGLCIQDNVYMHHKTSGAVYVYENELLVFNHNVPHSMDPVTRLDCRNIVAMVGVLK